VPELGLGKLVSDISPQVFPSSVEVISKSLSLRVRPMAFKFPFFKNKMLGWMAPMVLPSLTGGVAVHVLPLSELRSRLRKIPHTFPPGTASTGHR